MTLSIITSLAASSSANHTVQQYYIWAIIGCVVAVIATGATFLMRYMNKIKKDAVDKEKNSEALQANTLATVKLGTSMETLATKLNDFVMEVKLTLGDHSRSIVEHDRRLESLERFRGHIS